jgi:hypothetical protein
MKASKHIWKGDECFIKTTDDFYPNFPGGLVKLSYRISKQYGAWIAVWGNDDTGYEKNFDISDVRDAYRKLKNKGTITVKELIDNGFKGA